MIYNSIERRHDLYPPGRPVNSEYLDGYVASLTPFTYEYATVFGLKQALSLAVPELPEQTKSNCRPVLSLFSDSYDVVGIREYIGPVPEIIGVDWKNDRLPTPNRHRVDIARAMLIPGNKCDNNENEILDMMRIYPSLILVRHPGLFDENNGYHDNGRFDEFEMRVIPWVSIAYFYQIPLLFTFDGHEIPTLNKVKSRILKDSPDAAVITQDSSTAVYSVDPDTGISVYHDLHILRYPI